MKEQASGKQERAEMEAAKAESLRAAIAEARAKAEVIAEAAGLKITGITG